MQSVALRIICDREDEINAFIPEEYWSLDATVDVEGEKKPITAKLYGRGDNKIAISSKEEMDKVLDEIKGKDCKVQNIEKGQRSNKAPLPFYDQYFAAGGFKGFEFSDFKDNAYSSAAL